MEDMKDTTVVVEMTVIESTIKVLPGSIKLDIIAERFIYTREETA